MEKDPDKHCSKHPDGPKIRARRIGSLETVWCCLLCGEHLYDAAPLQTCGEVRDTQTIDSVGDIESVLGALGEIPAKPG